MEEEQECLSLFVPLIKNTDERLPYRNENPCYRAPGRCIHSTTYTEKPAESRRQWESNPVPPATDKGKQSEHAESMTRSIHVKTKRDSRLLLVPSLLLMVSDSTPSVFQRCINHANILTSRTFRSTTASNLIASTWATGSVLDAYHYTQRHYGESDESTFGGGQLAASKTRAAK